MLTFTWEPTAPPTSTTPQATAIVGTTPYRRAMAMPAATAQAARVAIEKPFEPVKTIAAMRTALAATRAIRRRGVADAQTIMRLEAK